MAILQLILVPLIVIIVIVVVIAAAALLNRGKRLKCPQCGQVFKSPLMDQKMFGAGWTLPYLGSVKCPHCGSERSRQEYEKVNAAEAKTDPSA
jgi:hypothetical protein